MKLVFLLEEPSMKAALEGVLPRLLPDDVCFQLIPHEGISDLERSIPIKLRGWNEPDVHFIVVRDQENHPDCKALKARIAALCAKAGRPDTLVRIVCRALESWFLADLSAVGSAFAKPRLARQQDRNPQRAPDNIVSPVQVLKALVPAFQKTTGARAIGPHLDLDNARSPSFRAFIAGVRRLAAQEHSNGAA